jgi:hypothetical protein
MGNGTKKLWLWISRLTCTQSRKIFFIGINGLKDMLPSPGPVRRGNDSLEVEDIGIEQQVHHGLNVIGISAANVSGNQYARPDLRKRKLLSHDGARAEARFNKNHPAGNKTKPKEAHSENPKRCVRHFHQN